ncbi:type II secretion system protein [Candidatus Parcubacteria bacterium]|nr:type II secretion system protein [Candidatus Parcubacteria bacterium]
MIGNNIKNKKGFILIEMLVALAVFMIVVVSITSLSVSAIRNQKIILKSQELFSQTSYTLEYMSRALRMAQKDLQGNCLVFPATNDSYQNPLGDSSIVRFLNYQGECQEFYLDSGELKERKSSDHDWTHFATGVALTSDHMTIHSLNFHLIGASHADNLQPRVTMSLDIQVNSISDAPRFKIQTTISQRNLDL